MELDDDFLERVRDTLRQTRDALDNIMIADDDIILSSQILLTEGDDMSKQRPTILQEQRQREGEAANKVKDLAAQKEKLQKQLTALRPPTGPIPEGYGVPGSLSGNDSSCWRGLD